MGFYFFIMEKNNNGQNHCVFLVCTICNAKKWQYCFYRFALPHLATTMTGSWSPTLSWWYTWERNSWLWYARTDACYTSAMSLRSCGTSSSAKSHSTRSTVSRLWPSALAGRCSPRRHTTWGAAWLSPWETRWAEVFPNSQFPPNFFALGRVPTAAVKICNICGPVKATITLIIFFKKETFIWKSEAQIFKFI